MMRSDGIFFRTSWYVETRRYSIPMRLFSISITILILLSGCAGRPQVQPQTKLIEYDACLTFQREQQKEALSILFGGLDKIRQSEVIAKSTDPDKLTGKLSSLELAIKNCRKYKP